MIVYDLHYIQMLIYNIVKTLALCYGVCMLFCTSVNTGAIAPVCTHFLNYINNWWYCNVINL